MQKIILSQDTIDKIISSYKDNVNITNLKETFGISRRVIERYITESGLELKTKSDLLRRKIPQLEDREYLLKLYNQDNLSIKEISIILNTNEQVIKTAFKKLGLVARNAKEAKIASVKKLIPKLGDPFYLRRIYLDEKKSPKQISVELGCSTKAVETALRESNIRTRKHKESLRRNNPNQTMNARIARNLRTRLWIALNRQPKMASAVKDLGCSLDELRQEIEQKFYPHSETGEIMSWDNYGEGGWEIDHINPLSSYDLSLEKEQKDASNHLNLQPLWMVDNRRKNNSILGQQPNKVPMYVVTGVSGCGKSWVCDQLKNINYISFDSVPKEQHYHYMVELSKNGRPLIYDPVRKAKTFVRRYSGVFDTRLIVIDETSEVVAARLKGRGSLLKQEDIEKYIVENKRKCAKAAFSGTSQEVLDYLVENTNKAP